MEELRAIPLRFIRDHVANEQRMGTDGLKIDDLDFANAEGVRRNRQREHS